MKFTQISKFLDKVTWKPNHSFVLGSDIRGTHFIYIRAENVPDSNDVKIFRDFEGCICYLPTHEKITEEFLIRELRMLCHRWQLHEADEYLKVDGKTPYNPHREVLN